MCDDSSLAVRAIRSVIERRKNEVRDEVASVVALGGLELGTDTSNDARSNDGLEP